MTDLVEIHFSDCCLLFANDWFLVVAGNIVENNSILVNILKYSQASFSSFSVVWLGSSISSSSWPVTDITDVLGSSVAPVYTPSSVVNITSSPEVGLSTISSKESDEVLSLCITVQVYWSHSHATAILLSTTSCKLSAYILWSISPWNDEVLSSKRMVRSRSWASTSSTWRALLLRTLCLLRTWCWTVWATTEKWSEESAKLCLDGKNGAKCNK